MRPGVPGYGDLFFQLVGIAFAIFLSLVHGAKCAPVVGAADRCLQDQASPFAGRAKNIALVLQWKHELITLS